ncbi:hypothetical protein ACLESD_34435 [Pyxidicoccus sp. 3LFB2]
MLAVDDAGRAVTPPGYVPPWKSVEPVVAPVLKARAGPRGRKSETGIRHVWRTVLRRWRDVDRKPGPGTSLRLAPRTVLPLCQ